jgi:NADPH2:quinone reductase
VLVHGAGGGVGTLLVQLAVSAGAQVVGTGRGAQAALIEELGARFIDYRREDVPARVRQLCPAGVAAVFDHVGGESLRTSYGLLARRGTLIYPSIAATLPLTRASEALRLHESGGTAGKILLVPTQQPAA